MEYDIYKYRDTIVVEDSDGKLYKLVEAEPGEIDEEETVYEGHVNSAKGGATDSSCCNY